MAITAIIVTHNSAEVIGDALACVYGHENILQCVVVDNASSDDTAAIIQKDFPQVQLIRNLDNNGFGTACNQALALCNTPFALLLNPDATIDASGINQLLTVMDTHPNAAIAVPDFGGEQSEEQVVPVTHVSGALMLWRMKHMQQVGFFDPALFLFYEDDDISIRVKTSGYDLLRVANIQATHSVGRSCGLTPELESLKLRSSVWSHLYICKKYQGLLVAKALAIWMVIKYLLAVSYLHAYRWPYFRRADSYYDIAQKKHERKWRMTAQKYSKEEAIRIHEGQWLRIARSLSDKELTSRAYERRMAAAAQFLKNSKSFKPI